MELLNQLMQNLNITEDQAKGGAGALFDMAQKTLSDDAFAKVADAVPGMDDLLSAAPQSGGVMGALGGLASSLGGGADKLGGLASVAGSFSKLDLDPGMITQFVPVVLSFVQQNGGNVVKGLLENVFKPS